MQSKIDTNHHFVTLALPIPIHKEFIYRIPEALSAYVSVGKRILVPFGRRITAGYAVGFPKESDTAGINDIKYIIDVLDDKPIFDESRLEFYKWMSLYYFSPLGEVLKLIHLPQSDKRYFAITDMGIESLQKSLKDSEADILKVIAGKKSVSLKVISKYTRIKDLHSIICELLEKGLIAELSNTKDSIKDKETALEQGDLDDEEDILHEPNTEQSYAISRIAEKVKSQRFSPFLLYGVTGSGKTLVYLKVLEKTIDMGKRGIVLVPEIALTYGLARYLVKRFEDRVAVIHSGLSDKERYEQWRRIRDGNIDIVVGARSSLFVPLDNIGIIIVDEEHDTSYKQEEGVRYNARDISMMMAKILNIVVVLGSATPSVETFYNAKSSKISLLHLSMRVLDRPMPEIKIVDMKEKSQESKILSERFRSLLADALSKKQQAILFLNRRGFANFIICKDCGYVFKCLNCNVSMTFHKKQNIIKCHYCDLSMPVPSFCPQCNGYNIVDMGTGTEKVEEEIRRLFSDVKVVRMDRDTTRKKGAHKKILRTVEKGEADILIGTQMVAKGHHFSNVTVMGIISADTTMNIPDFRSAEKTFQILTQAAGRAGRGDIPGKVIIQTLNPHHYCFFSIMNHDYTSFFNEEIGKRKELNYPPFYRLVNLRIEGSKEDKVIKAANTLKRVADGYIGRFKGDIILLGPAPTFLSFLRGRYRWHMLVKGKNVKTLHDFIHSIKNRFEQNKMTGIELVIDVDPMTTM
ncbi:MAG: primosomal protein N' [Deltaproteobacteria bacterium]|nr:primosomal protein N' [Deltaproteobacteria bacterium]